MFFKGAVGLEETVRTAASLSAVRSRDLSNQLARLARGLKAGETGGSSEAERENIIGLQPRTTHRRIV
jgi:hypothetical protein